MNPKQKKDDPYFYPKLIGLLILVAIGFLVLTVAGPLLAFFVFVPWLIWNIYKNEASKNKGP